MDLINRNGTSFYQFPNLAEYAGISHGIFTRHSGWSAGAFSSLNISTGVGDDKDKVLSNRQIISRCFEANRLVFVKQVHGNKVFVLNSHNYKEAPEGQSVPRVGDALVTSLNREFLVIQVADCQPVLIYEPRRRVVANIHAGWRGSINNIIGRTIQVMENQLGCSADHIVAGIGPSLGPCCAEFVNYRNEIPEKFWKFKNARHYFDFWAISREQLLKAGVLEKNISISNMCTRCRTDLFFSYRAEGTTGRFAAVIGLR